MKVPALFKNKYVLYGLLFVGIANVLGYLALKDYDSLTLLMALGLLMGYFSKNMAVNIFVAVVVTSLIAVNKKVREGFEGKEEDKKEKEGMKSKKDFKCAKETFRGCNRDGIIAASVYISCRIHNYPRTAKEIATIFNLDNTSATKGCKNAVHLLNMDDNDNMVESINFYETKPIAFIERYCSRLSLNKELTMVCKFVANKIEKEHIIPENTPHSVAAGIVYFVSQCCNLNVSKKMVNNCSEISEVTINKCYKKLEKIKDKLIPNVILKKYSL